MGAWRGRAAAASMYRRRLTLNGLARTIKEIGGSASDGTLVETLSKE